MSPKTRESVPESDHAVLEALASCPAQRTLIHSLPTQGEDFTLGGAVASAALAVVASAYREATNRIFVVVAPDPSSAASAEADLDSLLGEGHAYLYPQRESLPYESGETHLEIGGLRVEAVEALFSGRSRLLVTTFRALQEKAPVPAGLTDLRISLKQGEAVGFQTLQRRLEKRGFERVPLVEEVGQFAVRGGILDVFSFGAPEPVRLEFWGDDVESIRFFDILDQRSTREAEEVHLLPVDFRVTEEDREAPPKSLLELLPGEALLCVLGDQDWGEWSRKTWDRVVQLHSDRAAKRADLPPPESLFLDPSAAERAIAPFPRLILTEEPRGEAILDVEPVPRIDRDMDELARVLREGRALGHRTLILCDNEGQLQRLEEILGESGSLPEGVQVAVGSLTGGFVLRSSDPPLRVLTDHEIFRRARRIRRGRRFRGAVALESLAQLTPGDYVVHMDHGIGMFNGLEHIEVGGEELEALAIQYANEEVLRVPVYRIDLIERWVGETEKAEPPPVHRIGGRRWKKLRRKTEAAIETMAAELLQLYAERQTAEGFAFSPDTRWQKEMESSFLYEDTPDQRKATRDVKRDMESSKPMDRLICGDVGYGKTEIAVRAAFKAVQDGKQVAILAPTTILVEQHRHTFEERLADYPVRVGALSRFRTAKEQRELLAELRAGQLDIVVGTHRLLEPDIEFSDLGLLVVDEEQRFGVKHKERLKRLRTSVDVLTLTATPIPRTLQLSLSGFRDLTLIRTPPRDRMPIITHVLPWYDHILEEAVGRELDRGGQVFFLHNRVETIHTAAEKMRRLAPDATVEVAHGQMTARELDRAMTGFVDGEVDVLVTSSIIENGLDVPNANTLIVDRADRFGLSQLYQIRGRVGRSDRRAYAYLVVPDRITEDAEKRLKVLEHYTELGSGYSVAMKDLELRGAGNLLGADQSGFAHAVGLDTYVRLLEKTVQRLKEGRRGEEVSHPDPEISLAGSAYLPDGYVSDAGQKLHLYRRLSKVEKQTEVDALRHELRDRFGPPPEEVKRLLEAHSLRLLGRELGLQRLFVRDRRARLTFREKVIPKLAALERPLQDLQIQVEVRRMDPLSLVLTQGGTEPLTETLIRALGLLAERPEQLAIA